MSSPTIAEFLTRLRRLDINLWRDGEQLRYNAPTGALTPALRAEMLQRKTEILAFLQAAEAAVRPQTPPLTPVKRDGPQPLSFAQQRLWFIHQLQPESAAYHIPLAVRLCGPLEIDRLSHSLNQIIWRHESLRTYFSRPDETPVQIIHPAAEVSLPLIQQDVSQATPAQLAAKLSELARQPFELTRWPLLRAVLLRRAAEEHILLLVMHHIIIDGWSLEIMLQELSTFYQVYQQTDAPELPPLPVQYADFARWQRRWFAAESSPLQSQRTYWQERLKKPLPVLDLPTDQPRPARQSLRGAHYTFKISADLTEALQRLSRQAEVTLFMTLLAAFKLLLYRYTNQTDLVVGNTVANRPRPELEPLIGFFVNTLALRTDLSGDPTFRALLERVRGVTLAALAHQDLPFEQVVEVVQPVRDQSRQPLFQVMFDMQPLPLTALDLPGLTGEWVEVETHAAQFDLTLSLEQHPAGLLATLEYNTDLFEPATIERLAGQWQTVLRSVTANPDQPLSEVTLLTEAEREQLLVTWNQTNTDYPGHATIPALFAAQVQRRPEALALSFPEDPTDPASPARRLTYAELDRRANRLAHFLQEAGVGPESLAAVFLEPSPELIIALLAILKAGGAYLPLDLAYPPERIAFMLADANVKLMLTQESLQPHLPPETARLICLDREWPLIAQQPATAPAVPLQAGNLAYVMYTSGSTGRPKGAAITHQAIIRLVRQTDYAQLGPEDRVGQVSNVAFDAFTFELWGALLNGGGLVGLDRQTILEPETFAAALRTQQISAMFLTAALFNQMAGQVPTAFQGMRHLLVGGEALDPGWIRTVLEAGPPARLLNGYGPTETTTFAVCHLIQSVPEEATQIPIGRPIANTQAYILDENLRLCPQGAPGQLYLGGAGLARGYFNRPGLTAEKFIPHPFQAGARLYKTGDLARYRADGAIEFLGRVDDQVKIRGFRIEPGEIEALLGEHPAVQNAVVVVRQAEPAQKYLAAYVVPSPEAASGTAASDLPERLRQFLSQKLPDYMIPASFTRLEALPLTPNGKVDRACLPAPASPNPAAGPDYTAPRNPVEEILAGLWAALLPVERVGVTDNFFELGGHSLLATQLMGQINKTFQLSAPLRSLFEAPTVAGLAQKLVEHETRPGQVETIARLRRQIKEMTPEKRQAMLARKKTS